MVVVDAPAGAAAKVEVVALSGGRQLRRVEGTLEHLASVSDVDGCIVQAIVDTDELVPPRDASGRGNGDLGGAGWLGWPGC